MANRIRIKNGVASGVYDDRLLPIYWALGLRVEITRASNVEYDSRLKAWVAVSEQSHKIIAIDCLRNECIAKEIKVLERGL